jgi:hypothetical protein
MNNEHKPNESDTAEKEANETPKESTATATEGGEFKVTVRKLEMPVRPRGVLAE